MRQMGQKVLIIAAPSQDKEGIVLQIKPFPHLSKYIVGPVSLPVLRKVGESQVIGCNHIRLFHQSVFCRQDIDFVRVPLGVLVRKRKQLTGRIQFPGRAWVVRLYLLQEISAILMGLIPPSSFSLNQFLRAL